MRSRGILMNRLSDDRTRGTIVFAVAIMLAIVLSIPGPAHAENYARRNNEGNELVEEGMLDRALQKYKEAEIEAPEVPEIDYNKANVFHMMGNYDSAATEYQDALATLTGPTAPDALYNLGNTLYRMEQYELAVESYKRALIDDPTDQDAKHNLELALKRLQADSSQQEQKDQDQEQQPDSSSQDQDQKKNQDQQPDSAGQEQPQDQSGDSKPDSSESRPQPENPEDSQPGQREPQQMPQTQGMTKEDAERLLDALKDDELEVQKKRAMKAAIPVTGKDW